MCPSSLGQATHKDDPDQPARTNSPKQHLLSRGRLTTKSIPLNKHQFNFIHQQFRGQEKKARNKLNFKIVVQQMELNYVTQLRKSLE